MKKNNILKKLVLTTIALLLICNISGLAFGIDNLVETHSMPLSMQNEVYVNDDYPSENSTHFRTIQGGVNAVNSSGTIGTVYVFNGTYSESVIIKKPVRIMGLYGNDGYGDDPNYPPNVSDSTVAFIIMGNNAKGTNISHFNIIGGTVAGILVLNSKFINISYNNILLNKRGIYLLSSSSCNITCNNVFRNTFMGISLDTANDCKILGNWVVNNNPDHINTMDSSGIDLFNSCSALIQSNNISYNGNYTIWIGRCDNKSVTTINIIKENDIFDNETTFKANKHPRWGNSANEWISNYWSDATHNEIWHRYFVRGSVTPGFGWILRGILIGKFDTSSKMTPYGYGPNEI